MTSQLKAAVAGLGNMGSHHVRVLSEMADVDLVAVADPSDDARERIVRERPLVAHESLDQLLSSHELDFVVVAVPTTLHEEASIMVLDAGKHLLVEKPAAASFVGVRHIMAAKKEGQIASVGHIERFNPAVLKLRELLEAGELGRIFQVRSRRTGPLPARIQDVGVVTDLATHDLDMMNYLVPGRVQSVFAHTAQRLHSLQEDLAAALLAFDSGVSASLDVNWLTPVKIRELVVVGEGGMYRLDFMNQDLYFYENSHTAYWNRAGGSKGVSEGNMTRYWVERREPLRVELETFVAVIRGEQPESDLVPLEDGAVAVSLAEAVLESSRAGIPIAPEVVDAESTHEIPIVR